MSGKPIAEQEVGFALLNDMVATQKLQFQEENLFYIISARNILSKMR